MAIPTVTTQTSNTVAADSVTSDKIDAEAIVNDHLSPGFGPTQCMVFEYSFARAGGAQGAIILTDINGQAQQLPAKALIKSCHLEVITVPTSSGSATIDNGITGNADLFNDDAFDATLYGTIGLFTSVADEIAANVKLAAATNVITTIGTADLTAGKFRLHIEFREGA